MPQPIETAPRDRTILTNLGFAKNHKKSGYWYTGSLDVWVACDPFGNAFNDSDYGITELNPTHWEPIPEWITECNRSHT